MQYTQLGLTDLRVSRLCLGTVFRQQADESVYLATIEAALAMGCNFFDTSNVYQDGASERILGRAMRGRRDRFIVTTKVGSPEADEPAAKGLSRKNILHCCEKSLKRLDTDVIDLYLCHFPDPETPIDETVDALDTLVRQGKVRHVGCSNFEHGRLYEALHASERHGQTKFMCNQLSYSLLDRKIEDAMLTYCQQEYMGVMVYAVTVIGLLSGDYRYGQPPPPGSSWHRGPYNYLTAMTPDVGRVIDAVIAIAECHNRTPTQVAIAWCLSQPAIHSVIIGCDTPQHLQENMAACSWMLSDEDLRTLDQVSKGLHIEVRKDCPEGYDIQTRRLGLQSQMNRS